MSPHEASQNDENTWHLFEIREKARKLYMELKKLHKNLVNIFTLKMKKPWPSEIKWFAQDKINCC